MPGPIFIRAVDWGRRQIAADTNVVFPANIDGVFDMVEYIGEHRDSSGGKKWHQIDTDNPPSLG